LKKEQTPICLDALVLAECEWGTVSEGEWTRYFDEEVDEEGFMSKDGDIPSRQ
jgi:hypothetical protein